MNWLDFLDAFNLIDRLEGILARFRHADWQGAGASGMAGEATRALAGVNAWTFRVPRDSDWTGAQIEALLRKYGVVVWGRRITGEHVIFSVKRRQANWAEYLLMRRGIPVDGTPFNRRNPVYGQWHAPGDSPPAWADQPARDKHWAERLIELLD